MNIKDLTKDENDFINYLIKNKPDHISMMLKKKYPNLYNEIIIETSFLEETKKLKNNTKQVKSKIKFSERLYCFLNKINTITICPICKKNKNKFKTFNQGYNEYCSITCSSNSPTLKEKKENTCLKKYGFTTNLKSKETKDKIKQTNLKKYGVEYNSQSKEVKNKKRKKNLLNHNVENYSQINIDNYDSYNKIYIEENFIKNGIVNIKKMATFFNIHTLTVHRFLKRNNINFDETVKEFKNLPEIELYTYINEIIDKTQHNKGLTYKISKNNNNVIYNDKKALELDIYIEIINDKNEIIKKIAIEYNGLIFHSFGISNYSMFNNYTNESKDKYKHLKKTELCEEQNIKLFHINENEWLSVKSKNIWKSIIKNELLLSTNKIFARKCYIQEIDNKLKNDFLEDNHLQGKVNSSINLGLFTKEENKLVSIMTFSKPRYTKEYEYELMRFVNILDTNIIGAGSKLLKYFEINYQPISLISYGNRRWTYSLKNFYKTTNFEYIKSSPINYYYFIPKLNTKLYHRSVFQKHKIKKYFETEKYNIKKFNKEETETINLYKNGYRKIYDSGQLIYVIKY
jgi:hypothetical protein